MFVVVGRKTPDDGSFDAAGPLPPIEEPGQDAAFTNDDDDENENDFGNKRLPDPVWLPESWRDVVPYRGESSPQSWRDVL